MKTLKLKHYTKYYTRGYRGSFDTKKNKKSIEKSELFFNYNIHNDNNWYYMNLSSIYDNIITEVYKIDRYCRDLSKFKIKNKDIIIPLIGNSFKPIYFDNMFPYFSSEFFTSNINLLITNNLALIEIDENLIDPRYIMSILESKETQEFLKSKAKGRRTKTISENLIMNIDIPTVTKEKMEKIATEYTEKNIKIDKDLKDFALNILSQGKGNIDKYIKTYDGMIRFMLRMKKIYQDKYGNVKEDLDIKKLSKELSECISMS